MCGMCEEFEIEFADPDVEAARTLKQLPADAFWPATMAYLRERGAFVNHFAECAHPVVNGNFQCEDCGAPSVGWAMELAARS